MDAESAGDAKKLNQPGGILRTEVFVNCHPLEISDETALGAALKPGFDFKIAAGESLVAIILANNAASIPGRSHCRSGRIIDTFLCGRTYPAVVTDTADSGTDCATSQSAPKGAAGESLAAGDTGQSANRTTGDSTNSGR